MSAGVYLAQPQSLRAPPSPPPWPIALPPLVSVCLRRPTVGASAGASAARPDRQNLRQTQRDLLSRLASRHGFRPLHRSRWIPAQQRPRKVQERYGILGRSLASSTRQSRSSLSDKHLPVRRLTVPRIRDVPSPFARLPVPRLRRSAPGVPRGHSAQSDCSTRYARSVRGRQTP